MDVGRLVFLTPPSVPEEEVTEPFLFVPVGVVSRVVRVLLLEDVRPLQLAPHEVRELVVVAPLLLPWFPPVVAVGQKVPEHAEFN